jgi:hypothetical protein
MNYYGLFLFASSFIILESVMAEDFVNWPKLEDIKVVSGRAATETDVKEGHAVFVLKSGSIPIGNPLSIALPQYAIHIDNETKARTPCILIQAEEANGHNLGGCRLVSDSSFLAGFINEFELHGNKTPK